MATADLSVGVALDAYDPPEFTPDEEMTFDEKFLARSLKQLFDAHSSVELRWEVKHWVFSVPFVSGDHAEPALRRALVAVVDRCREALNGDFSSIDPAATYSVKLPALELDDVPFRVAADFDVIPYRYSFEAVCMRLQLDPEEMRSRIRQMMDSQGITQLIDNGEMAVRSKRAPADHDQADCVGFDWSNPRSFVTLDEPVHLREGPPMGPVNNEPSPEQTELF